MTLIASGRRRSPALELPYPVPTSAPYNAPEPLITPTYDGSGLTVHPDVIDFWTMHGIRRWNGYRFWMGHTPYPASQYSYENPSILASNDGVNWELPPGAPNPIYPRPSTQWNSDTDLVYDGTDLWMFFRTSGSIQVVARSHDGVTWPPSATPLTGWESVAGIHHVSPAVVRMGDGSWAMWTLSSRILYRWTAAAPEGPWSGPVACTGLGATAWHIDVTRIGGTLLMFVDHGREDEAQSLDGVRAAVSHDGGITWTERPTPLLELNRTGAWDRGGFYRGTLQPHEDGVHMRVWYGATPVRSPSAWRVGLTLIPIAEWIAP